MLLRGNNPCRSEGISLHHLFIVCDSEMGALKIRPSCLGCDQKTYCSILVDCVGNNGTRPFIIWLILDIAVLLQMVGINQAEQRIHDIL